MNKTRTVRVGGMSEASYDLSTLETMKAEGLGDYTVLFVGPWQNEQVERVGRFCRENGYRFVMDERINRLSGKLGSRYSPLDHQELAEILEQYRDCCDGSLFMCEFGGLMLYWPTSTVESSPLIIPPTDNFAEAETAMVDSLRSVIADSQAVNVTRPLVCIEASGTVARWLYQAGIDRVDLEVTYDRDNELFFSAAKGAARAYGKDTFGVDMAMVWYGGDSQHDELWFQRWRTSLYHAFIRGADPIYAEHGLMDYQALGKSRATHDPEVVRFREILGEVAQVVAANPRPSDFPLARIGVIQGHLDSYAGLFQTHVWGQRDNDDLRLGEAEHAWQLFETFYRRQPWEFRHAWGDTDTSGNPPLGQVDVVPSEAPAEVLQRYDCLLFLGWNSMTDELYDKLRGYVHGGGHLLATLAHLSTATSRHGENPLIHDGDLRDLFGVQVDASSPLPLPQGIKFRQNPPLGDYQLPLRSPSCDPDYCGGFPMAQVRLAGACTIAVGSDRNHQAQWPEQPIVLTAHQHGDGQAMLLNSLAYPGNPGVAPLYRDLLRFVAAAWQPELRIIAGDRVRYAVYPHGDDTLTYLLNTEPHLDQTVRFGEKSLSLQPGELAAVIARDGTVLRHQSLTHPRES